MKLFYQYATEEGMPIVQAAKQARKELIEQVRNVAGQYQTAVGIRLIKKPGAENLYLAP